MPRTVYKCHYGHKHLTLILYGINYALAWSKLLPFSQFLHPYGTKLCLPTLYSRPGKPHYAFIQGGADVSTSAREIEISNCCEDHLLEKYFERWRKYHAGAKYLDRLFHYLNAQYVNKLKITDSDLFYGRLFREENQVNTKFVGELAMDVWNEKMVRPLTDRLVALLLKEIKRYRNGVPVNTDVLSGFYIQKFEIPFLKDTSEYYVDIAVRMLATTTPSEYMQFVLEKIRQEEARSERILHRSGVDKVQQICQEVLVNRHMSMFKSVAKEIVREENLADLSNMYALLSAKSSDLSFLVNEFESYVRGIGQHCMQNLKGDDFTLQLQVAQQFVEEILAVFDKYGQIVKKTFKGDHEFSAALDRACLAVINHRNGSKDPAKAAEWLSKHIDQILRKSTKPIVDSCIDFELTKAINILRFVDDKDLFHKYYSRSLANRLISGLSISIPAEETMIHKLKSCCGYEFISKFQRMLSDITLSKELTNNFVNYLQERVLGINVHMMVLQAGAWPLMQCQLKIPIPPVIENAINEFEQYYTRFFSGRKLSWMLQFSVVDVMLHYLHRRLMASVNLHQLAILLCFENHDQLALEDLKIRSGIQDGGFDSNLQCLIDAGILLRQSEKYDGQLRTKIILNKHLTSRRVKFRVNSPFFSDAFNKDLSAGRQVHADLKVDRKLFIECTLVRIMKSRKLIKHEDLLREVMEQCVGRFVPEVQMIKQAIESVIEKNFLRRTDNADEYAIVLCRSLKDLFSEIKKNFNSFKNSQKNYSNDVRINNVQSLMATGTQDGRYSLLRNWCPNQGRLTDLWIVLSGANFHPNRILDAAVTYIEIGMTPLEKWHLLAVDNTICNQSEHRIRMRCLSVLLVTMFVSSKVQAHGIFDWLNFGQAGLSPVPLSTSGQVVDYARQGVNFLSFLKSLKPLTTSRRRAERRKHRQRAKPLSEQAPDDETDLHTDDHRPLLLTSRRRANMPLYKAAPTLAESAQNFPGFGACLPNGTPFFNHISPSILQNMLRIFPGAQNFMRKMLPATRVHPKKLIGKWYWVLMTPAALSRHCATSDYHGLVLSRNGTGTFATFDSFRDGSSYGLPKFGFGYDQVVYTSSDYDEDDYNTETQYNYVVLSNWARYPVIALAKNVEQFMMSDFEQLKNDLNRDGLHNKVTELLKKECLQVIIAQKCKEKHFSGCETTNIRAIESPNKSNSFKWKESRLKKWKEGFVSE
ncbi:Cullin-2 [Trichinella nativa]|uniref:Cullin-2 n=1 Tax=Trichinella nativa TaxID=6335 RepID=A0A0V1KTM4_9BILA|nr:Cullin-2 [Trichinella nativa]